MFLKLSSLLHHIQFFFFLLFSVSHLIYFFVFPSFFSGFFYLLRNFWPNVYVFTASNTGPAWETIYTRTKNGLFFVYIRTWRASASPPPVLSSRPFLRILSYNFCIEKINFLVVKNDKIGNSFET